MKKYPEILVKVEQKHIDEALALRKKGKIKFISQSCPVAFAMRDVGIIESRVAPNILGDISGTYYVPKSVVKFIKAFDRYGKKEVKPFKFLLRRMDFETGVDAE